MKGSF